MNQLVLAHHIDEVQGRFGRGLFGAEQKRKGGRECPACQVFPARHMACMSALSAKLSLAIAKPMSTSATKRYCRGRYDIRQGRKCQDSLSVSVYG